MRFDKDRIKESLTNEEVTTILLDLGSGVPRKDREGNLIFTTVCHGGSSYKLYYYPESMTFYCYSQCNDSVDIYELVIRAKKQQGYTYTFQQAIEYVVKLTNKQFGFGFTTQKESTDKISDWDWLSKFSNEKKSIKELPEYESQVLEIATPYIHNSWVDEGISYEVSQRYGVRYYLRDDAESIIIPHHDTEGRLIGIRRRSLLQEDEDNGRKYMPFILNKKVYSHPTMMSLYGLYQNKETIKRMKKVVIFEGEKSVQKTESIYGKDNNFSCATCSSQISTYQRDLLLSLGVDEVMIAFDTLSHDATDEMVQRYKDKLYKFALLFAPYVRTYILYDDFKLLGEKMSPVDKGKEPLELLMKNKFEITTRGGTR